MLNLKKIIEDLDLDEYEVAKAMWPKSAHPLRALQRVYNNGQSVDVGQLKALSTITGHSADELLNWTGWAMTSDKQHIIKFERGAFTAELDTEKWRTSLWKNGSLKVSTHLLQPHIQLKEYVEWLDMATAKL